MNTDRLRSNIKSFIREISFILLYVSLSFIIAYLFNVTFYAINMPPTISNEDQRKFSRECGIRMQENSVYMPFGDIKLNYLGEYKYDYKIIFMTDLDNINETRQRILNSITKKYSYYVGWGCLIIMILIRFLSKFIRWLYPKN